SARPRLEEQTWQGHWRRRHHWRARSYLDADSDQMEQSLLQEPVRKRVGADEKPGRRKAVEGEGRGSVHPRRFRQVEEACADHADDGPIAALGSSLRKDLAALLRASGPVRRRV